MIITRKKLFITSLVILITAVICIVGTNHVVVMDANETYERFSDNFVSLMIGIWSLGIFLSMLGGIGLMWAFIALVREHVKFDI